MGRLLLADPRVGYEALDDLAAFMSEAMALWQHLCCWRDGRKQADTYLAGAVVGPWLGWQPHQPRTGWPETGRILASGSQCGDRLDGEIPSGENLTSF